MDAPKTQTISTLWPTDVIPIAKRAHVTFPMVVVAVVHAPKITRAVWITAVFPPWRAATPARRVVPYAAAFVVKNAVPVREIPRAPAVNAFQRKCLAPPTT